jgi:hypothetical protein
MGLDIRLPLGLIFLVTGLILVVYGAITHGSTMYAASLGVNINLVWGAIMSACGLISVLLARKGRSL